MTELRDRDLVRLYWPVEMRPAFDALLAIDDAMADVVAKATDPTLAAIKLAWWRERLEELDHGQAPAEPRLQAALCLLIPQGISGRELAGLEEPWAFLLHEDDQLTFMRGVTARGPRLFALLARLLRIEMDERLESAAHSFTASDLGRRRITSLEPLKLGRSKTRARRAMRPLTMLEVLARRDMRTGGPPFEPEATPRRAFALLRHKWTGRIA